jgi:hypothetical protein
MRNFIAGLLILQDYYDGEGDCMVETDEFHAEATDRPLPPAQVKEMERLGWKQDTNVRDPLTGWTYYF